MIKSGEKICLKTINLTLADIRFQWKYGFYGVYAIFTVVYILALFAVPEGVRQTVATVMIFTDPAAMGLFFMGAIILLEKSQHVNCALAVSPVKVWEYCMAKLLSLAFIGGVVATILAWVGAIDNIVLCLLGVVLSSFICSASGFIAAEISKTLNQFILLSVPFEMGICLPPALLLFGMDYKILMLHPGVAAVKLIYGEVEYAWLCILSLVIWCLMVLPLCIRCVRRRFLQMGGARI